MANFEDWFAELPLITKWYLLASVATTIAANFNILDPMTLIYTGDLMRTMEWWRVVTSFFFFGKLSLGFLIQMVFWARHASVLEKEAFNNNRADFLTFIFFCVLTIIGVNMISNQFLLGPILVMAVIYLWARRYYEQTVTFMFGFSFKAIYFPFVLLGFDVLMGQSPWADIMGIVVGHAYHYLVDIYPSTSGKTLLWTPEFMRRLFPQPDEGANRPRRDFFGGGGQVLGRHHHRE